MMLYGRFEISQILKSKVKKVRKLTTDMFICLFDKERTKKKFPPAVIIWQITEAKGMKLG